MTQFIIRYGILPSNIIFNVFTPGFNRNIIGWSPEKIKERQNAGDNYIDMRNKHDGFFRKLEESILKNGIQNPILVSSGFCRPTLRDRLPLEWQDDNNKILTNDNGNGGSRLLIAQKHQMNIPCIIMDHNNRFSELKELRDIEDIEKVYHDKPGTIKIVTKGEDRVGVIIYDLPHTHM
jgi:hypothetical protein